ncbi:MAG TPA: DoxX family membrane protein [Steroidobacteraceae bacterium]|nr:DoxX family membrane protein [Steroidobacteraceae bacterium]
MGLNNRTVARRAVFVVAMGGTGVLSLIYGDFALQWQPFPASVPAKHIFAYGSGVLVVVSAFGVLFNRAALPSALVLCVYQLVWAVLRAAQIPPEWFDIGRWLGFCEALALLVGTGFLLRSLPAGARIQSARPTRDIAWTGIARISFGVCCIGFGLSHFAYAQFTADMIPGWLPQRVWLAYFTGAAHIAAGLGIALAIVPRAAATLEAMMMSSFVILVHVPSLLAAPPPAWAPTSRMQWTALCMAACLAGSAWLMAGSFSNRRSLRSKRL